MSVEADALFLGSVLTMDPARPRAQGVAVRSGRVIALGSAEDLHPLAGPGTEVHELGSACLLPGFHDAHVHLAGFGLELAQLDLSSAATFEEAAAMLRDRSRALPDGELLRATGMALNSWGVAGIGDRERDVLSAAVEGRRAIVRSQDHHSAWASPALLEAAGVHAGTSDPADGVVVRNDEGEPTGLLLEAAQGLVDHALPRASRDELERAIQEAGRRLASLGITTVHSMAAEPPEHFRAVASIASGGSYPVRVWACVAHEDLESAAAIGLATGQGGDDFAIGGAKFFADGALGSRTAWMLEPYVGSTGVGMAVDGPDVLAKRVPLAVRAGLTPVVHAIGDAAVRATLDAFAASADSIAEAGLRPRLEHAQHVHPADIERAGRLGVVVSVQPIHLTFDAAAVRDLLGDRVERAYPLRSLARGGATLAFGSDAPVASPDVMSGLRAACRRAGRDGERLNPSEAVSPDAALMAYTTGAAAAIGREGRSGKLAPGYDADMVVLSHDPLVSLDGLEVMATYKAGMKTYGGQSVERE